MHGGLPRPVQSVRHAMPVVPRLLLDGPVGVLRTERRLRSLRRRRAPPAACAAKAACGARANGALEAGVGRLATDAARSPVGAGEVGPALVLPALWPHRAGRGLRGQARGVGTTVAGSPPFRLPSPRRAPAPRDVTAPRPGRQGRPVAGRPCAARRLIRLELAFAACEGLEVQARGLQFRA